MPTPAEMKKALVQAGFVVYVTRGDIVHLAEHVRENLLMDAGVFVRASGPAVGFVAKAQKNDFPQDSEAELWNRVRALAQSALSRGYREVKCEVREVRDPGNAERLLDRVFEVFFEKPAESDESLKEELSFAFSLARSAEPA